MNRNADGRMCPTTTEPLEAPGPPADVQQPGDTDGIVDGEVTRKLLDDPRKTFGQKGRARTMIVNLSEILEHGVDLSVLAWVDRDGLSQDLERLRRAVETTRSELARPTRSRLHPSQDA
jgi:hypothetical protein